MPSIFSERAQEHLCCGYTQMFSLCYNDNNLCQGPLIVYQYPIPLLFRFRIPHFWLNTWPNEMKTTFSVISLTQAQYVKKLWPMGIFSELYVWFSGYASGVHSHKRSAQINKHEMKAQSYTSHLGVHIRAFQHLLKVETYEGSNSSSLYSRAHKCESKKQSTGDVDVV